jgi:hypothetical protein
VAPEKDYGRAKSEFDTRIMGEKGGKEEGIRVIATALGLMNEANTGA